MYADSMIVDSPYVCIMDCSLSEVSIMDGCLLVLHWVAMRRIGPPPSQNSMYVSYDEHPKVNA